MLRRGTMKVELTISLEKAKIWTAAGWRRRVSAVLYASLGFNNRGDEKFLVIWAFCTPVRVCVWAIC